MRLNSAAAAAVGFFAGLVCGQYTYPEGLGIVDSLGPYSWPLAVAKPPVFVKRDGSCASGSHPCSDVNSTSCCYNTQYCIVNTSWETQCCEIGSVCSNPCDEEHYYANETVTSTITASASLTAALVTTITQGICSGRSCSGSYYGCPTSLGGGCCGFGTNCATDTLGSGICIGPSSATSSTTAPSATSTGSALPTGAVIQQKSSGLSTGAKAGIAIGVILFAALVIGALTYVCLRRRRTGARSVEATTAQELPSMTPAGRVAASAPPQMSEADADAFSYGSAPSSTGLSRAGNTTTTKISNDNGFAQRDYFGEVGVEPGLRGTPQQAQEQLGHPHEPDYGVAPVEIGTRVSIPMSRRPPGAHSRMDSQGSEADGSQSELADTSSRGPLPAFGAYSGPASPVENSAEPYELYGDFGPVASEHDDEFHEAQESVGGDPSRAIVQGGRSSNRLPQPLATPGSEMSEFAMPSPMSREEEAHPRREV